MSPSMQYDGRWGGITEISPFFDYISKINIWVTAFANTLQINHLIACLTLSTVTNSYKNKFQNNSPGFL